MLSVKGLMSAGSAASQSATGNFVLFVDARLKYFSCAMLSLNSNAVTVETVLNFHSRRL